MELPRAGIGPKIADTPNPLVNHQKHVQYWMVIKWWSISYCQAHSFHSYCLSYRIPNINPMVSPLNIVIVVGLISHHTCFFLFLNNFKGYPWLFGQTQQLTHTHSNISLNGWYYSSRHGPCRNDKLPQKVTCTNPAGNASNACEMLLTEFSLAHHGAGI